MKILLVEHVRELLFSLDRFLILQGHQVENAFDGVIAINNFDDSFDLVIIDGDIPRIPCLEIIKLIKNKKKDIRIIVLINDSLLSDDILYSNEFVDDFVPRPFAPQDILDVINHLSIRHSCSKFYTNKEYILLEKLRKNEIVSFNEIYELIYKNEVMVNTYIGVINKKLKEEKIVLQEKGFKLVLKND